MKELKELFIAFAITTLLFANFLGVGAHFSGITTGHVSSDIATNALQIFIPWWTIWAASLTSALLAFLFLAAWEVGTRISTWTKAKLQRQYIL